MKKYAILGFLLIFTVSTKAQLLKTLKDKVVRTTEQKAEQKTDAKIDRTIDAALDSVIEGNIHIPKQESSPEKDSLKAAEDIGKKEAKTKVAYETSYVSKFDFVPGEKVIVSEDFADDAIGDFPAKWNTTGSGEVVSINGLDGKWLMMNSQSNYSFNDLLSLPENFTIQFEVMLSLPFIWGSEPIYFGLADVKNPGNYLTSHYSLNGNNNICFWMNLHPNDASYNSNAYGGYLMYNTSVNNLVNEKLDLKNYFVSERENLPLKVSVSKQKQRLRVYLNENKVLDLPKILPAEMNVNALVWQTLSLQGDNKYFIGNIRIAVGNPDSRNKLLSEGKLVSNGILFEVNSDVIKPESYGVLKEIAGVLNENKDLNVMIVGHTDSDGNDAANLELSIKRAKAVKHMLSQEYKIDPSRLQTDGKGEAEPISPNTNSVTKANNRRVEFIKIT